MMWDGVSGHPLHGDDDGGRARMRARAPVAPVPPLRDPVLPPVLPPAARDTRLPPVPQPVPQPDMHPPEARRPAAPLNRFAALRQKHVTILMATFNGGRFLAQQLDSFLAQSHANWSLWVSDDGSKDQTREILDAFRAAHPDRDIRLFDGPRQGAAANFLSLLCRPELPEGHVAFSDQDDVWLPHKLRRALRRLLDAPADTPVLYGSRTVITNRQGRRQRLSRLHERPLGLHNALIQNIIAGNTAVLNPAATRLMRRASAGIEVPFHDWWLYLVTTAAGGTVIFDSKPGLLYRQHGGNHLGTRHKLRAQLDRLRRLQAREFARWNHANLAALARHRDLATPEARALLDAFTDLRDRPGLRALHRFHQIGLYRQSPLEELALYWAALRGRL